MTDTTETVTLSKPLKTHSGEVTAITLKEPTARSYDHGEPFKVRPISDDSGGGFDFDFNNVVFKKFLSDMTGYDDLVLSGLRASDYLALRWRAAQMIIGVAGANPTDT